MSAKRKSLAQVEYEEAAVEKSKKAKTDGEAKEDEETCKYSNEYVSKRFLEEYPGSLLSRIRTHSPTLTHS